MTEMHLRTREQPMWSAYRVEGWDRDGHGYAVGDSISFDVTVFEPRTTKQHTERREGHVVELWVEPWWGNPDPLLYAEVDGTDEHEYRVWFHRDHVTPTLGFLTTPEPEGALF